MSVGLYYHRVTFPGDVPVYSLKPKKLFNPARITYIRLLLVKLLRFRNISDGLEILEKQTGHFTLMNFIISIVMFWALFIHFCPKF